MTFTPSITGKVDTNNSTSTPLGADATFTGVATDSSKFESATLTITSDYPSANSGVRVEHSQDGTNWDYVDVFTYDAKHEFIKTLATKCAFIRVLYDNDGNAQTEFRLQLLLRASAGYDEKKENLDAFGRLRVSNPNTLLEINHLRGLNDSQESALIEGTGTQTLDTRSPFILQSVSDAGDRSTRQSRKRATYQPGKSHLILMSGVINAGNNDTGVISNIGYFDNNDGCFFSHAGDGGSGTMKAVLRTSGKFASPVQREAKQSEWNIDRMDGNGESGILLDTSKTLIFYYDIEWLGVGRVRYGFIIKGELYFVHEFYHSNLETIPYMSMPSLPTRYEIYSNNPSATGSLKNICSQVSSEGGHNVKGRQFSVNSLASGGKAVGSTLTPLICLRLKSTEPEVNAVLENYSVLSDGKALMATCLVLVKDDATAITGATWTSADDESAIEYDIAGTAINMTNATVLDNDFVESKSSKKISGDVLNSTLTTNIIGVSDILVLCTQKVSNNGTGYAGVTWNEYL
jgi:hypothetical protein